MKNNNNTQQLLNISEAAIYLGTTPDWIKFLAEHCLIVPIFLPFYVKPRYSKNGLDSFVKRVSKFQNGKIEDKELQEAFFLAAKKINKKYGRFQKEAS
ncbi:MAG: hypothetical protein ABFS12_13975 [Bacteroidota bacterium]